MAHSPRTQHCSPAHGCGRPSTPCRPAAAEPRKPTGRGWCPSLCRQHCQPWVGRRHDRRPGCVLGTELQPLPVVLHLGPAPSLGWHGGAGAAVWLRTGTRASLGAGAEQMAPNGSVRVHPAGRPLADCWQPVELLGQNGSAWGEHAGPQREAGAPSSAATGPGGWSPRCWPSLDSTRPGTWPRQAQVGHLPRASLQISVLGGRAAAVPVASHQAQLGPTLRFMLSPAPEDASFPCCMGLLQRSPLPTSCTPHVPAAVRPQAPAPAP